MNIRWDDRRVQENNNIFGVSLAKLPDGKYMRTVTEIVNNHLLKSFFRVDVIECSAKKVAFGLTPQASLFNKELQGMYGCVFDCAARSAGYASIGQCILSECEMTVHSSPSSSELIVKARIASAHTLHAIYCSEIYSVKGRRKILVAESQGTLSKSTLIDPS